MSACRPILLASLVALAGCKEDLLGDLPDASEANIDAADIPTPAGDFSCIGTPYPETAPDPLSIRGGVLVNGAPGGGVTVEIRRAADDVLLAQDVTDSTLGDRMGKYNQNVVTGGVAPLIYRRIAGTTGRPDMYQFDGFPVSVGHDLWVDTFNEARTSAFFDIAGVPRDPAKGMIYVSVFDCGIPLAPIRQVAGATVEAPPGTTVVYSAPDGSLNPAATETSTHGGLVVLNVPPGFVDLDVRAGPVQYRSWPVRVHASSWTASPRHP